MKSLCTGIAIALVVVATTAAQDSQKTKYGVIVDAEKNVDFGKFMSYSWTTGRPSFDKTIDARVIAAVDRELTGLGMMKASSGSGDVQVSYTSLTRTDVDVKGKANGNGARPQQTVGTLVVALFEPATHRRLLQLRLDRPIDVDRSKLDATIDDAVAALFAKYPTRKSK